MMVRKLRFFFPVKADYWIAVTKEFPSEIWSRWVQRELFESESVVFGVVLLRDGRKLEKDGKRHLVGEDFSLLNSEDPSATPKSRLIQPFHGFTSYILLLFFNF